MIRQHEPATREFAPGDIAWRRHTFTRESFDVFAELSGDRNPIHHDRSYTAVTDYGSPIVPLVMVLGPVSALIGMVLPGPGALILSTVFRPVHPVAFDVEVSYSLRVVSASPATGLTLRVLALQNRVVVLEGEVQAATAGPPQPDIDAGSAGALIGAGSRRIAAVTGAAGDIGSAVALWLARAGWDLALLHRGSQEPGSALADLVRRCLEYGAEVTTIQADLALPAERADAASQLRQLAPAALIHAAAAPLEASHADQFEVSYAGLRDLTDAVLDGMLLRQEGWLVLLGSEATRYHPPGWQDYIAAKTAAEGLLSGLHSRYGRHGLRSIVMSPSYVEGRYSASVRPSGEIVLAPEEVAEVIGQELEAPSEGGRGGLSRIWLRPGQLDRAGPEGMVSAASPALAGVPLAQPVAADVSGAADVRRRVESSIRRVLQLSDDTDLQTGGIGLTAGWDSLRQIQIVLELEAEFGMSLTAQELVTATRVSDLCELVERHGGRRGE